MAWGNGLVDASDLAVLFDYWCQDLRPPDPNAPAAHWKLDESQGMTAYDSAGDNHGTLIGDPVWQPTGGQIDGALELDGVGDGVETGFVVDPSAGQFSVLAWVQGGAPYQIIISQSNAQNWLEAAQDGNLTAGIAAWLVGKVLSSETQITDGAWHHVGFVWDSGTRMLYADGVEVARDSSDPPRSSSGGMHIGAPPRLQWAFGYWSGLIDDVRIYDRPVSSDEIAALAQP
jgi:hypothetical protein